MKTGQLFRGAPTKEGIAYYAVPLALVVFAVVMIKVFGDGPSQKPTSKGEQ